MTTGQTVVASHLEYLRDRIEYRVVGERVWVAFPQTFLDGDAVELAVRDQDDGTIAVSDLGETLRRLALLGYEPRETPNGRFLINQITKQYRVEVDPSGVIYRIAEPRDLGETVLELISASLAMGNLVFLARAVRPATIQEEVAEFLRKSGLEFRERERVPGHTGKRYTVDFVIRGEQTRLVKTIATATPSGVTASTNAAFRAWHDIKDGWKATILDDRVWPWRPEDVAILSTVSKVFRWSDQADEFVSSLGRPVPVAQKDAS